MITTLFLLPDTKNHLLLDSFLFTTYIFLQLFNILNLSTLMNRSEFKERLVRKFILARKLLVIIIIYFLIEKNAGFLLGIESLDGKYNFYSFIIGSTNILWNSILTIVP